MNEFIRLMDSLTGKKRKELQDLFLGAPYWLLKEFRVRNISKGTEFISSGEPAKNIYVLVEGKVKATDYHRYEFVYDYTAFEPVHVFGAMEFYMDSENYITTLITTTNCVMLEIPREMYIKWLMGDTRMMLKQIRDMLQNLTDESKKERTFVFLNGTQRMYYLVARMYERQAVNGILTIRKTKDELANIAGTDVRTVNRAIKIMSEEQVISKEGRALLVNLEQYQKISRKLKTMIEKTEDNNGKEENFTRL